MKEKQQTREQLVIELAKIRESHAGWVSADERKRKEFAKAFRWYIQRPYGGEKEVSLPTWEQIFVNLGTLLAARTFLDCDGNISELEVRIDNLENEIRKEIHPTDKQI